MEDFSFSEYHPDPIIGLDFSYQITYMNLSARTLFPSLKASGAKHPVLIILVKEFEKLKRNGNELIFFSQDINYLDTIYEQQVLVMPDKATIYVFMSEIILPNGR